MLIRAFVALGLALLALPSAAADKPQWEAGAGVGVMSLPAWRGADDRHNYVLPLPYFVYHGDFFRADRHGVRGVFFDSDRVELGVSVAGSPPTGSQRNSAREGMDELRATGEIGPLLDLTLWRSPDQSRLLKLILPLRAAFTFSGSPESIGWVFSPALNLDVNDVAGQPGWNLGLRSGPIFATRRQHAYFYGVAPAQATASRQAYAADGGYSGFQFIAAFSKRFPKYWVGSFMRYDSLAGAAFEDSPLVAHKHYLAAGLGVVWIIGESTTRVTVDE